ncbi:hypothetical protein SAMN02745166_02244 [Prosthecobacter debontii]|uniref:Uncharacterized protein n=1 Tax=Prosthecobacter debontii TaxID=48467 RepID=A0A1T4Y0Z2_9BACT|nr:hypothetical protein [Prosthecobacter debontii]SKA94925.1 hypothetical protein SAMN02745166_02244 [Prosthecobacter debontii]
MESPAQEKLDREQITGYLNRYLPIIASVAGVPLREGEAWGIRLLSWTGEEWPGLEGRPGLIYVDLFVTQPPHDYLLILDISTGTCTLAASYQRELKHMRLLRAWAPATDSPAYTPLPDHVPWRLLRELHAPKPSPSPHPTPTPKVDRLTLEVLIRRDIKRIAKQSSLVGVDDHPWDVTRISWTGEEWPGLPHLPGYCYVEAFEHANPPHDFLYVVSVLTGTPEFIAAYEGDIATFDLTVYHTSAESLGLPEQVER